MSSFAAEQDIYDVLGTFFSNSAQDEALGHAIQQSGLVIQFEYSNPDAVLTIDTRSAPEGAYFTVIQGPTEVPADIKLSMKADSANKFWLGKLNLMVAFSLRQIVIEGSMGEVMKLLPVIQSSHSKYREHLESLGRSDLLE